MAAEAVHFSEIIGGPEIRIVVLDNPILVKKNRMLRDASEEVPVAFARRKRNANLKIVQHPVPACFAHWRGLVRVPRGIPVGFAHSAAASRTRRRVIGRKCRGNFRGVETAEEDVVEDAEDDAEEEVKDDEAAGERDFVTERKRETEFAFPIGKV